MRIKSLLLGIVLMIASTQASTVIYLENSVKTPLVYEQNSLLPIVSMQLVFGMSGSIEDKEKAGLAKAVAKLLGEGTKAKGSAEFALELESSAIHLSASVGIETFVFELSCLKSGFPKAIKALKELLNDPNLTSQQLKRVKTTLTGSILQSESNYDTVASKELKKVLFESTALELPTSGTLESIESITLKDVKNFFKEHIIVENAMGVIGGDISQDEAVKYLNSIVSTLPRGTKKDIPTIAVRKKAKAVTLKRDTKQAYIYFGSPFFVTPSSDEYYKARVALYVLGAGGFGTRLMEEIRVKRGLAYSAYANMSSNNSHQYMNGYLQTKIESSKEALDLVKSEIKHFVKEGVTQNELDGAKEFLLGSEPLRSETLSQRLSRTFMAFYKGLPLNSDKKELEQIASLTLSDLNAFITKHDELNDLSVVIVTQ